MPAILRGRRRGSLTSIGDAMLDRFAWMAAHPWLTAFEGPQEHLWFLPALITALGLLAVALWLGLASSHVVAAGVVLYLVALAAGSYQPLTGADIAFNPRNGPFVALLFVAIGAWLQGRPVVSRRAALGVAGLGLTLCTVEAAMLWAIADRSISSHDALLGTAPLGIGAFLFALAAPLTAQEAVRMSLRSEASAKARAEAKAGQVISKTVIPQVDNVSNQLPVIGD